MRRLISDSLLHYIQLFSRTSLENELIPELKKSIDELKEECYALLDETVHSPVISLESFVSVLYAFLWITL